MKFEIEDPRLTAYVLGELSPEDAAEVEALLADDVDAREFADSMRETTEALSFSLQDAGLGADIGASDAGASDIGEMRRARIAKAASSASGRSAKRLALYAVPFVAAAAVIALVALPKGDSPEGEEGSALVSGNSAPAENRFSDKFVSNSRLSSATLQKEGKSDPLEEVEEEDTGTEPGGTGEFRDVDTLRTLSVDTSKAAGLSKQQAARSGVHGYVDGVVGDSTDAYRPGPQKPSAGHRSDSKVSGEIDEKTRRQLESLGYFGGEEELPRQRQAYSEPAVDSPFVKVKVDPLSTFSVDVDTASYSQMRKSIKSGWLPQPGQVRIEEMLNYFSYQYAPAVGPAPFGVLGEVAQAPWNTKHKLVRIGIKAKEIEDGRRRRANLVFLLDVSGSMSDKDKLPLLKKSFGMLLDALDGEDRIAIVVYAGASGLALPSTAVAKRSKILASLRRLESGGSTNGGAGIELAYKIAQENFIEGGVNRVILATDGDFNVGTVHREDLVRLIEKKAKKDVFLTVLGVGMSSYGDTTMETLADKGNGNYAYIDTLNEAKKVLVDQLQGTLVTVAKDVKLQVEFNPKRVAEYRLIGYENRRLANEDFRDDTKDAGEIGAGHRVTALYEIVPVGVSSGIALRYQKGAESSLATTTAAADSGELLTIKLRYKEPTGTKSKLFSVPVADTNASFRAASIDFRFASAVAAFGMILRQSKYKGEASLAEVETWAAKSKGSDLHGYRAEFVRLVRRAKKLR